MDEFNSNLNRAEYTFEDLESLSEQLNRHSRRYSTPFNEEDEAKIK